MTVIAWTGHRPKDLDPTFTFTRFTAILDGLGMNARDDVRFITGGALGIDTMAAEYAITRNIPLTLILPFNIATMTKFWREHDALTLAEHWLKADETIALSHDTYNVAMYDKRNHEMVDRADIVFAVWTGKPVGGTSNCIRYAHKVNKPVWNLLPADGKLHKVPATQSTRR